MLQSNSDYPCLGYPVPSLHSYAWIGATRILLSWVFLIAASNAVRNLGLHLLGASLPFRVMEGYHGGWRSIWTNLCASSEYRWFGLPIYWTISIEQALMLDVYEHWNYQYRWAIVSLESADGELSDLGDSGVSQSTVAFSRCTYCSSTSSTHLTLMAPLPLPSELHPNLSAEFMVIRFLDVRASARDKAFSVSWVEIQSVCHLMSSTSSGRYSSRKSRSGTSVSCDFWRLDIDPLC